MRPRIINFFNELSGFNIFEYVIPESSVIYFAAFLLVAIVFYRRSTQNGFNGLVIFACILWGGFGAFVGSKLFYTFVHLQSFIVRPEHIFQSGGTVSWGAYLGMFGGVYFFLRLKNYPVLPAFDILASSLALGPFIGRWSCFLAGDDFGRLTSVSWAVRYPYGSSPYAEHIEKGVITPFDTLSAAVHPNQIYLSISALILFFLISYFWKRLKEYKGATFFLFFYSYALLRFFIEFFRAENIIGQTGLILPQLFCLATLIISAAALVIICCKNDLFFAINPFPSYPKEVV